MKKNNRILIGTRDIANNIHMLKSGFQSLGFNVTTCSTKTNKYYNNNADIDISSLFNSLTQNLKNERNSLTIHENYKNLFDFDTYIFVTESLFPGMLDLPILRRQEKNIFFYPTGSDLRFWGNAITFNKFFKCKFPEKLISNSRNIVDSIYDLSAHSVYSDFYSKKLHNTRMIEMHSNLYLASPNYAQFSVSPYFGIMIPCITSACRPYIPRREKPLVLHIPSSREKKQTDIILKALNKISAEGIIFDFKLIENIGNDLVLKELSDCDVLIAQIGPGKASLVCLEGLASGCCVIGPNNEYGRPIPYNSVPIVNINNNNIYDKIKTVLTNKQLRIDMAEAGIEYMRLGLHEPSTVAEYMISCSERAKKENFDYYPTFFLEHSAPPEGEHVPEYLKQMTWQLMKKHGVAPDFKPKHAFMAGHLPKGVTPEMTMKLPRWDESKFRKKCFWGWWAKDAIYPHGPHGIKGKDDVLERLAELSVRFQN